MATLNLITLKDVFFKVWFLYNNQIYKWMQEKEELE